MRDGLRFVLALAVGTGLVMGCGGDGDGGGGGSGGNFVVCPGLDQPLVGACLAETACYEYRQDPANGVDYTLGCENPDLADPEQFEYLPGGCPTGWKAIGGCSYYVGGEFSVAYDASVTRADCEMFGGCYIP